MQAQAIPIVKKRRGFNADNPRHQKRVKEFAEKYYQKLKENNDQGNPYKLYKCCQAFMSRSKRDHHHDEKEAISFTIIRDVYGAKDQASFIAALTKILKECNQRGLVIYGPTYNTEHIEPLEDSEEEIIEGHKQLIVQNDEILSFEHQLKQKDKLIARLQAENEEMTNRTELANFEAYRVTTLLHKTYLYPNDLENPYQLALAGERCLENMIYDCKNCRQKLDRKRIKAIRGRIEWAGNKVKSITAGFLSRSSETKFD